MKLEIDLLKNDALILVALESLGFAPDEARGPGFWSLPWGFNVGVIVLDALPETDETVCLRLLGRGFTLERAARYLRVRAAQDDKLILQTLQLWGIYQQIFGPNDPWMQEMIMQLNIDKVRELVEQKLTENLVPQITQRVRAELEPQIRDEVMQQVKAELTQQVKAELTQQVKDEVAQQVRAEVTQQVKAELTQQVEAEVTQRVEARLRQELEAKIRQELMAQAAKPQEA